MSKNEKAEALESNGSNKLTRTKHMNNTANQFSFQTELFQTKPKTKIQHSSCHECGDDSPIDGYRFRLVPICECCRTEREVEITGNRFERRQPR